jgi:hypothetical protein
MLLVWLLIRWQRVRDDRLLLVVGAVIGIAAMTKFQVMLLCLVLLVVVAVCGPRDLLRRPLFWAGAALAALIAAPTLIWQHLRAWPQLRMTPVVSGEAEALYGGRPGVAVELLVFAGLAGLVLASYGLLRLLRADEMRAVPDALQPLLHRCPRGRRHRRRHARLFAVRTTAVVGIDLAEGAHVDGVLNTVPGD